VKETKDLAAGFRVSKKGSCFAGFVTGHPRELKRRFQHVFFSRGIEKGFIGLFGSALEEMEATTGPKNMSTFIGARRQQYYWYCL